MVCTTTTTTTTTTATTKNEKKKKRIGRLFNNFDKSINFKRSISLRRLYVI